MKCKLPRERHVDTDFRSYTLCISMYVVGLRDACRCAISSPVYRSTVVHTFSTLAKTDQTPPPPANTFSTARPQSSFTACYAALSNCVGPVVNFELENVLHSLKAHCKCSWFFWSPPPGLACRRAYVRPMLLPCMFFKRSHWRPIIPECASPHFQSRYIYWWA